MSEGPSARWSRVSMLFDELAELPQDERAARLAALAQDDPALARELGALLAADARASGVLDGSLDEVVPDLSAAAERVAWDRSPGTRIGAYRLIEPIGQGGMGEVWLAERADGEYQQRVALKLLKRGMDTQAILRRFLQERSILARLNHPRIVRLLDGGMSPDDRPYYVMDHVAGAAIDRYAARHALDVRRRVALVAGIADAVAYAHARLIVHRDLKPSNILVGDDGVPHLLDFGIAKLLEDTGEHTLTGTATRVLSPAYAAPEQILGEPVGTATDVYALGAVLFELLTGALPHRRSSRSPERLAIELTQDVGERASQALARADRGTLAAIYGDGADPRRLAREAAGDLDVIVATALRREPERRYATAAAFAEDLRRWLDGRPIAARADSARYRTAKFVRRHKLGVAAAALVLLSLLSGLGIALWQAEIAREHAQRAERQAERAERVKSFLIALFEQNDPAIAQGKVLTAAEILARGRDSLPTRLADEPEVRGELLVAIAKIQESLGEFPEGARTAEQAVELLEAHLPGDDPRLAEAYITRAMLYSFVDRQLDGVRDLEAARVILARDPERYADRLDYLDSELAGLLRVTESSAAAARLQQQVIERMERRLGADHPEVAQRRVWLAVLLEDASDYAGAERAYRRSLPVLEAALGTLDPELCLAWYSFAGLLGRLRRHEESLAYFERALDGQRELFGADSIPYGKTVFSRGITFIGLMRYVEAEADFRAALATLPEVSTTAAHAQRYLGQALAGQERYAEAAEQYRRAEATYRRVDLPNDIQRWRAHADYGYARFMLGHADEGRAAVEAAIAGMRTKLDDDDVQFMRANKLLGEIARAQGDAATAVAAHRRWRELVVLHFGEDVSDFQATGHQLALSLMAQGDADSLAEARALIADAVARARADGAPMLAEYEKAQRIIENASPIPAPRRASGT